MNLTEYWRIVRAHWVVIVVCTVIGGVAAFGWTLTQPKVYSANASGILAAGVSSDLSSAVAGDSYAKSRVRAYLDVAKSRSVAQSAIDGLELDVEPDVLIRRIAVMNPLDTPVLRVTANAPTPQQAADLAEAWVDGISDKVDALENAGVPAGSAGRSIVTFELLDSAALPGEPTSPNTSLAVAIGLFLGLVVGIGYALLRNVFDRRVRSPEQLEKETGLPVIGTLPFNTTFTLKHRLVEPQPDDEPTKNASEHEFAEAIRELRTNLKFMDVDNPPRVIVVTSSLPGEGKSTVTANLAVAIAAAGEQVVVVDGDLRRPAVASVFGLVPGVGLTDVLIGRAELNDVVQPWGHSGRLFVLGAGTTPPNPSELLSSKAMGALLHELSKVAIVLIDAPPLIPVTDAAILTARTDGAIILALARRTTYESVVRASQHVDRVKGRTLGVILNGVRRTGRKSSSYGYYSAAYGKPEAAGDGAVPVPVVPADRAPDTRRGVERVAS